MTLALAFASVGSRPVASQQIGVMGAALLGLLLTLAGRLCHYSTPVLVKAVSQRDTGLPRSQAPPDATRDPENANGELATCPARSDAGHHNHLDLVGKHGRVRTVPMPVWVKVAIDAWTTPACVADGYVFRSVNRGGQALGAALSEKVVWQMLRPYAAAAGVPGIAPHDCRRTAAKLCRAAGGELEQIQLLLGRSMNAALFWGIRLSKG